jgi:hypothetical protein
MSNAEPPQFKIGQAVLVDQGLPGEITAMKRGSAPGILGLRPLDTWLYVVEPEDGSDMQADIPEYNLLPG